MVVLRSAVEVEAGGDAAHHALDVAVHLLEVALGVEEQHRVGDVVGRRPALLDDAVHLGGVLARRPHDVVADVAGAGLQLARHRRLDLVPAVQPLGLGAAARGGG